MVKAFKRIIRELQKHARTIMQGKRSTNEPPHDETNKMICVPSEDSDQSDQSLCSVLNG